MRAKKQLQQRLQAREAEAAMVNARAQLDRTAAVLKAHAELPLTPAKGFPKRSVKAPAAIWMAYCLLGARLAVGLIVRVAPETETCAASVTEITTSPELSMGWIVMLPVPG